MTERSSFSVFLNALPILGVDGTLAEAVPTSSPARGRVRAKTGTYVIHNPYTDSLLLTSKALAGYLEAKSGRKLAFAIFVNNVPPAPDDDGRPLAVRHGQTLGRLCEVLYDAL
jgi:D-alanyl-D-alanine carboxypeptidase/D-alanyl-D-alanine-endopeptidase (penicillin-binding protein 4)